MGKSELEAFLISLKIDKKIAMRLASDTIAWRENVMKKHFIRKLYHEK